MVVTMVVSPSPSHPGGEVVVVGADAWAAALAAPAAAVALAATASFAAFAAAAWLHCMTNDTLPSFFGLSFSSMNPSARRNAASSPLHVVANTERFCFGTCTKKQLAR